MLERCWSGAGAVLERCDWCTARAKRSDTVGAAQVGCLASYHKHLKKSGIKRVSKSGRLDITVARTAHKRDSRGYPPEGASSGSISPKLGVVGRKGKKARERKRKTTLSLPRSFLLVHVHVHVHVCVSTVPGSTRVLRPRTIHCRSPFVEVYLGCVRALSSLSLYAGLPGKDFKHVYMSGCQNPEVACNS